MRFTKTLIAAGAISMAGTAATAGGIAPLPPQPEIEVIPTPAPGPVSSVPAGYIVLGLVAALVAASGSF
jgi:hypothetical protein